MRRGTGRCWVEAPEPTVRPVPHHHAGAFAIRSTFQKLLQSMSRDVVRRLADDHCEHDILPPGPRSRETSLFLGRCESRRHKESARNLDNSQNGLKNYGVALGEDYGGGSVDYGTATWARWPLLRRNKPHANGVRADGKGPDSPSMRSAVKPRHRFSCVAAHRARHGFGSPCHRRKTSCLLTPAFFRPSHCPHRGWAV